MKAILKSALLLCLLASIGSCIKVSQPCSKNYAFGFPISVTPKDTFTIGDTIWWEMDLPNQLFDTTSGEYIDLTDFELFFWFGVDKLEHNNTTMSNGYTHLFNFTAELGRVEHQSGALSTTYFITNTTQDKRFRIGCIPTEAGTYDAEVYFPGLYFNAEGLRGEELQIADPSCKEYITQRSKITINYKEINYNMMEGICRYTSSGSQRCYGPESELYMYNVYAFHVKEP